MTREEFIEKMDVIFERVGRGYASCSLISTMISYKARVYYNEEFRLSGYAFWVWIIYHLHIVTHMKIKSCYANSLFHGLRSGVWITNITWSIK